jgi:hypothetical protein
MGCTFRGGEVDDISVFFEHVHFLDGLDGLDVHLLKRGLELFVVDAGGGAFCRGFLHLAAGGAFASVWGYGLVLGAVDVCGRCGEGIGVRFAFVKEVRGDPM